MASCGNLSNCTLSSNQNQTITLTAGNIAECCFFVVTCLLIVGTNAFTLAVIHKHRDVFEEVSRFLYQCIAVIDCIGGVSGCVLRGILAIHSHVWPYTSIPCRTLIFLLYIGLLLSAIVLTGISVDRYIAISKPLRYPSIVTIRRVKLSLGLGMLLPLCFYALSLFEGSPVYNLANKECDHHGSNEPLTSQGRVVVYTLYSLSVAPIWTGMVLNCQSMVISTRRARVVPAQRVDDAGARNGNARNNPSSNLKGVKTIMFISTINMLVWSPAIVRLSLSIDATGGPPWVSTFLVSLNLVNFWSNALVFARTNPVYRKAAKAFFKELFCREPPLYNV